MALLSLLLLLLLSLLLLLLLSLLPLLSLLLLSLLFIFPTAAQKGHEATAGNKHTARSWLRTGSPEADESQQRLTYWGVVGVVVRIPGLAQVRCAKTHSGSRQSSLRYKRARRAGGQ